MFQKVYLLICQKFMKVSNDKPSWYQKNWHSLQQELDRLHQCLENTISGNNPLASPPSNLSETTPFAALVRKFDLSPFERDILLLALGSELDRAIPLLCAKIQGDSQQNYPTLGLALSIFPHASWSVLSPQNPLQAWQMLEFAPSFSLTQAAMRLDPRILCYLLGEAAIDERLTGLCQFPEPQDCFLSPSQAKVAEQIIATWSQSKDRLPILQLCGSNFTTKYQLVTQVCSTLGFSFGILDAASLPTDPQDLDQLRRRWEREAILSDRLLLIDSDSLNPEDTSRFHTLSLWVKTLQTPAILSSQNRLFFPQRPVICFDVPFLNRGEQQELWETHLGTAATELNGEMTRLTAQFDLSAMDIQAACDRAQAHPDEPLASALWQACRTQARPRLDHLAQRITSRGKWEDLVLPDLQREMLAELATQLQYRSKVYHDWGFMESGSRGLGMTALFYGQSGTGKTLAAEVLAQQFHLDLYRIDLSATISKYIGETEKNLAQIFDAAAVGGAILLFDEADALFGKRTEVRDSRDRHANVEVSYLLQRMEAYQGLAILTTNMKNALDNAFLRRIRFIVEFPFPAQEQRMEIWRRAFPAKTPTQGLDYQKLGQLQMPGGNIRNIALNAAFFAAGADEPVMMKHILQAARRECLKLQRSLTSNEINGWVKQQKQ